MTSWVVSAHATAYSSTVKGSSAVKLVQLPPGVRFHFFEKERVSLGVAKAWPIYNMLMNSNPAGSAGIAATLGYQMFNAPALPDYTITGDDSWIDKHNQSASGIFVKNDEHHNDPMTFYIKAGQTYSLSEFFADPALNWKPGDEVYWLACRNWA